MELRPKRPAQLGNERYFHRSFVFLKHVYFLTVPEAMKELLAAERRTRRPAGGISAVGHQKRVARTGGI